ncbi:unnamed protein product [Rotaria socialis]|uniref:WD repeat-containing protein 60 n=2 Tax=Rotaria socialis TaxID=392032 RepID=A0A817K3F5_9BILA|nr:unnamed protein product [Rotaria socialis]
MSSKKTRDSSKTKHSSKGDSREERHKGSSKDHRSTTDDQEERRRRSSKDHRSTTNDQDVSASRHRDKSKSKSSSKTNYVDEDAIALAEDEEERRRRKKQQRKQLEEEERLKREQEEYEEERRRRKEKNRDVENDGSRKHKSSRAKSPILDSSKPTSPVPPPTKHKNKPAEKDDNYSDDFEQNYDDDFDDEPIAPPVKKSTSYKEEKSRTTYNESPPTKNYTSSSGNDNAQVYTSSRRFQSHDLSDRIRRRYKDLSRLIQLDRQAFNILDMAPMPAHAAYMRDIRLNNNNNQSSNEISTDTNSWTANVKVQTNDDAEHVQSQTDEIDTRSMWTQHPSESEHTACGSGSTNSENQLSDINKTRENEDLLRMLRLETDLARYQTFVINAGKLMFALLDKQQTGEVKSKSKRSKDKEQDGMQQESDLSFSSGVTILPGLSLKPAVSVAAVCFFSDKPEQVAVFYEPIHTTSYGAIYNVRDPSKPLRLLSCEATIRSCSSSMVYIFAGCQDGSVVLFDTSEPNKYRTDSQKPMPSSPTFSTANIQFNDRHYNEVIRVLPLRTTSVPNKNDRSMNSFSLASLDRDGLIIIWSVVELMQSDEAGSIADLGLKPGGRVRMTQTSSIQIKQSIHMARDSIQAYDLSCPSSDFDNLYVASNANAVYHMTRYGEMGSPAKLRISSDLGSQIEVTCLSFNPLMSKLLLVGTGHGQLNLYTTGRDEPILTWPQAFRSSSIVLSCHWSTCRGSVFFAHDSQGYIKYWDLTKDQYQPLGQVKIENLSHFALSTSNQYETAFALVIKQQSSQIEIHQLKQTLASHSETFTDNFKDILKKIMANT